MYPARYMHTCTSVYMGDMYEDVYVEVTPDCSCGWENTQVSIYSAVAQSQTPHLGLTMLCLYKWLLTRLLMPITLRRCVVDGINKLVRDIKH